MTPVDADTDVEWLVGRERLLLPATHYISLSLFGRPLEPDSMPLVGFPGLSHNARLGMCNFAIPLMSSSYVLPSH